MKEPKIFKSFYDPKVLEDFIKGESAHLSLGYGRSVAGDIDLKLQAFFEIHGFPIDHGLCLYNSIINFYGLKGYDLAFHQDRGSLSGVKSIINVRGMGTLTFLQLKSDHYWEFDSLEEINPRDILKKINVPLGPGDVVAWDSETEKEGYYHGGKFKNRISIAARFS